MESESQLRWWHFALCQGMNDKREGDAPHEHKDNFYEEYEADPVLAKNMDDICKVCPVRQFCRREGEDNNEYGLWGGVFLNNGKVDESRNAHKTDADWEAVGGH